MEIHCWPRDLSRHLLVMLLLYIILKVSVLFSNKEFHICHLGSTFEPLTLTSTPVTTPVTTPFTTGTSCEKLEDKYKIGYSERGTSVVIIASEPITHSVSDWVIVPKNTALIVSREKSSYVNVMKAKFDDNGNIERKDEICR